jgi:D-arabinose 1-dehydrogenase-like Zn-dependent alcohol dehydrogenase
VRLNGLLLPLGGLGDASAQPVPLMMALVHSCVVRGVLGGTRNQLREVVKFIYDKGIVPAVDDVVFELVEAKDAWRRMKDKKHFAKIAIRIDH